MSDSSIRISNGQSHCPCPKCGALAGERCTSGGRIYLQGHKERRQPKPQAVAVPAFVRWWKEQKPYEGKYASPRPADLRVPTQAELMQGAA
jgi:hypothetical protein